MRMPNLTRRRLLKRVGVVVVGTALLQLSGRSTSGAHRVDAASSPPIVRSTVTGAIDRVEPFGVLHVRGVDGAYVIKTTNTTILYLGRTGHEVAFSAFVPGDEIVAEGQLASDGFIATTVMSLYRSVRGSITQRQGNRLQTTAGTVRLLSDTRALAADRLTGKALPQLMIGEEITALTWRDPTSSDFVAWMLGPVRNT